jgi:glycosyltransferase involved in cell wall biosynthesis
VKRVLYIENSGEIIGGGQISLLLLMENLDRDAFSPWCICPAPGGMSAEVRKLGIPVEICDMPALGLQTLPAVLLALWLLWRRARKIAPDLIHANGSRCMFYAGLAGWLAGVPVVWHVRIVNSDGWWDRVLAHLAQRIVVISQAVNQRFIFAQQQGKTRLVHNGVDVERFIGADGRAARRALQYGDEPLVGMVAQLVPWKRHADFIYAMGEVAKERPQTRFLIIGSDPHPQGGYGRSLQTLVDELGLSEWVHFVGFHADVAAIMAMLDIVVLTSDNEPFGRVLIEAMAAGKPVVATKGGGVPEIVVDNETGLLVPIGQRSALAAAVIFFLDHAERGREMGSAGRHRAEQCFSIATHARAIEAIYRELGGVNI